MATQDSHLNAESIDTPKPSPLRLLILCPSNHPLSSSALPSTTSSAQTTPANPLPSPPLAQTLIPPLLKSLTLAHPPETLSSFSGYTTHPPLKLRTAYYSADIGIWVDEVPHSNGSGSEEIKSSRDAGDKGVDDTVDALPPSLDDYKSLLLSSEAREVRDVIGGIVLTLPLAPPSTVQKSRDTIVQESLGVIEKYTDLISTVGEIRDEVEAERGGDVAGVIVLTAVSTPSSASTNNSEKRLEQSLLDDIVEKWEEALLQQGIMGWDIVAWEAHHQASSSSSSAPRTTTTSPSPDPTTEPSTEPPTNTYGELVGIPRLFQVLETVEWLASPTSGTFDDAILNDDDESPPLGAIPSSSTITPGQLENLTSTDPTPPTLLQRQSLLSGDTNPFLKSIDEFDLHGSDGGGVDGDDFQIESLPGLMERVTAIREEAAGLPEGKEREQFAKRAVERIMREL